MFHDQELKKLYTFGNIVNGYGNIVDKNGNYKDKNGYFHLSRRNEETLKLLYSEIEKLLIFSKVHKHKYSKHNGPIYYLFGK